MKTIIFIEGEYRIQPFMINELNAASKIFDKVFIITKELSSDISTTVLENEKIEHVVVSQKERLLYRFLTLPLWMSKQTLTQLKFAQKDQKVTRDYLASIARYISDGELFYKKAYSIIKNKTGNNDDIYVISTWFSIEAYSVAKLKQTISNIKAFSFAHSFEIDVKKDLNMAYNFNEFKHRYLDKVFFISKTMVDIYNCGSENRYLKYNFKNKVVYLGSNKKYEANNPVRTSKSFVICSCSNVIPIKNLSLIAEMLNSWNGSLIEWIHFGGGDSYDELKQKAKLINERNDRVKISLMGVKSNDDVQYYYSKNHIDVFVNVSISEGLPVSLMEAISYGIPIIATDVGGSKEIVHDNHGILLSSNPSVEELKFAIESFMRKTDVEVEIMRNHAIKYWTDFFNAKKNMEEFYIHLLADNIK